MGGANEQAEIRAQSIKGLIRYWWRALKAENDITKLREEETKIFGGQIVVKKKDTNGKEGEETISYKSPVKIVVSDSKLQTSSVSKDLKSEYKLNWFFNSKERKLEGNHNGIGYLLYSVLKKEHIKPGSIFSITFSSSDDEALKQTLAAFWCAIYLGGLGARSRRGAGSMYVSEVNGETYGINFTIENRSGTPNDWLKTNFEKCQDIVGKPKDFCHKYSNLSISRIIISKNSINDWINALSEIGNIYGDFRTSNRSKIFESAAFGLPIIHRSSEKVLTNNKDISRRASPLIFKILFFNGKYYWAILRMAGEFLPNNTVVSFNSKTQKVDYSLIDEFWNKLKSKNTELILQTPQSLENLKKKFREKTDK